MNSVSATGGPALQALLLLGMFGGGAANSAGAEAKPLPYPPTAVGVVSFDTNKVLYDEGEPVVFRCTLRLSNAGPSLAPSSLPVVCPPLVVQVWDEHDLDPPVPVAETKLEPKDPAKPVSVELAWKPPGKRYGHQAHLRVLDGGGRLLATASTVYEVCRDWQYVMRYASTAANNIAHPEIDDAQRLRIVEYLRQGHVNVLQFYETFPHYLDFTPDTPTWKSAGYSEPHHLPVSGENVKRLGCLLHDNGIRMVFYTETSAVNPELLKGEDPESYKVYWRDGAGKLQLHAPYYADRGWFQPNTLKIADRYARELEETVRSFGWDGVINDSATQAFWTTAYDFNVKGERITNLTPGEVGRRFYEKARKQARGINPLFRFLCQNVASSMLLFHYHWREPDDKIEQVIGDFMRQHYGAMFDSIDCWSAEMDPHYDNQPAYPQTYDKYATVLNIAREVSRKPILLWMHVSNPHIANEYGPEYVRPLLSVLAASRAAWHDHFSNWGGWWGPWNRAPVNQVQIQIHRFVARFSRYLRAPDLRWISRPEKNIQVESARALFWRRTVYQHEGTDGAREVTVNLINLDSEFLRPSNVAQAPHRVPPVAFPVTVRYRVPEGVAPASVVGFVADAQDESLGVLALRPDLAGDRATFHVPPVRSWTMLVIRGGPIGQAAK